MNGSHDKMNIRVSMALIGTIIIGFGCGLLVLADLGIDPYNAFIRGLNNISPFSYGLTSILTAAFLLIFILIMNKKYIGIGTFFNLLFSGYIIQFTLVVAPENALNANPYIKIIILLFGLMLISLGSSFFYTAGIGVSSYDAIALIITDRSKTSFRICRIATDGICTLTAFLLEAKIGITTVITVVSLGPAIDWLNKNLSIKILNGQTSNLLKILRISELERIKSEKQ